MTEINPRKEEIARERALALISSGYPVPTTDVDKLAQLIYNKLVEKD